MSQKIEKLVDGTLSKLEEGLKNVATQDEVDEACRAIFIEAFQQLYPFEREAFYRKLASKVHGDKWNLYKTQEKAWLDYEKLPQAQRPSKPPKKPPLAIPAQFTEKLFQRLGTQLLSIYQNPNVDNAPVKQAQVEPTHTLKKWLHKIIPTLYQYKNVLSLRSSYPQPLRFFANRLSEVAGSFLLGAGSLALAIWGIVYGLNKLASFINKTLILSMAEREFNEELAKHLESPATFDNAKLRAMFEIRQALNWIGLALLFPASSLDEEAEKLGKTKEELIQALEKEMNPSDEEIMQRIDYQIAEAYASQYNACLYFLKREPSVAEEEAMKRKILYAGLTDKVRVNDGSTVTTNLTSPYTPSHFAQLKIAAAVWQKIVFSPLQLGYGTQTEAPSFWLKAAKVVAMSLLVSSFAISAAVNYVNTAALVVIAAAYASLKVAVEYTIASPLLIIEAIEKARALSRDEVDQHLNNGVEAAFEESYQHMPAPRPAPVASCCGYELAVRETAGRSFWTSQPSNEPGFVADKQNEKQCQPS